MNTAVAQALTPSDATRHPRGVEGPDVSTASQLLLSDDLQMEEVPV